MTESLPPKPELPEPGDCCGGGCERCVFDAYEDRLREWQEAVAAIKGAGFAPFSPGGSPL